MTRLEGRLLEAVLFDKDGTLVDFHATWDRAFGVTLEQLAPDRAALELAASAVGYDLDSREVDPGSPLIAESNAAIMELLGPFVDVTRFESILSTQAEASVTPATGALELLELLVDAGTPAGVVTNDSEAVTHGQLARLGWERLFAVVIGYDSGHGAKPDPGPVLAALSALDATPSSAVLVGDSNHDLEAARRARVTTVYVGDDGDIGASADISVADLSELASLIT